MDKFENENPQKTIQGHITPIRNQTFVGVGERSEEDVDRVEKRATELDAIILGLENFYPGAALLSTALFSTLYFLALKAKKIGVIGFEPTTLWSQTRCASQTALHPVSKLVFSLTLVPNPLRFSGKTECQNQYAKTLT